MAKPHLQPHGKSYVQTLGLCGEPGLPGSRGWLCVLGVAQTYSPTLMRRCSHPVARNPADGCCDSALGEAEGQRRPLKGASAGQCAAGHPGLAADSAPSWAGTGHDSCVL